MEKKYSYRLYDNPISKLGAFLAIIFFAITAILLMLDYIGVELSPVLGMLGYSLLPMFFVLSVIAVPVGMFIEWRRRHIEERKRPPKFPRFDFNEPHQRNVLYVFIAVILAVGIFMAVISYHMYEFTESVTFCTEVCHKVMEPEAVTYHNSPHAHVPCAECHVGSGATWYVKSKLAGLYQVYAVLANKYPTPIETPVHNLRPARDTCEKCHWPTKFFGSYKKDFFYYDSDKNNTAHGYPILINVGGGTTPAGIHWHVDPGHTVYYVAADEERQEIPYVEVVSEDGTVDRFFDKESDLGRETLMSMEKREMDCIDCHNRPTHIFKSPNKALNDVLAHGEVSSDIPYIKKVGLEVLDKEYADKETALKEIEEGVRKFYGDNYADWLKVMKNRDKVETAVARIKKIYNDNNFLEMKSNWSVYPNNIGHLEWKGCFRCHKGNHETQDGRKIPNDCNICHTLVRKPLTMADYSSHLEQKDCNACHYLITKPLGKSDYSSQFVHPMDIGDALQSMSCRDCHNP